MDKEERGFVGEDEIRNRWNKDAVFMDAMYFDADEQIFPEVKQIVPEVKQIVPEDELLTGEISAVIRKIGCYSVRMSWRAYMYKDNQIIPADKKSVKIAKKIGELAKKSINGRSICLNLPEGLSVQYEISAKHINSPVKDYLNICDTSINPFHMPFTGICLVKENKSIPDEYASLLVYDRYTASSFGIDTWYKLAPTGKREYLSLHDLDPDIDKCTFVEYE